MIDNDLIDTDTRSAGALASFVMRSAMPHPDSRRTTENDAGARHTDGIDEASFT